jgi:hypothetical protein
LVERITESVELFLDHNGDSWARFECDGHYETHPLKVRQFKRYLINQHNCGEKALTGVLDVLDARAAASGKVCEVFLRTAWHEGTFYIDRGGPDWDAIRVNADGWSLIPSNECPVRFYRSQHTGELPHPERGGDIDDLRKLFQVEGTDWTLLLGISSAHSQRAEVTT